MDLIELLRNFGWLFFCIGMVQQQKELTYREKFNIVVWCCVVFQRAVVVITRKQFGLQALGKECAFSFFLIILWAAFSHDPLMYGWLFLWLVCMAKRRMEATRAFKNGESIDSRSDGIPINLGTDIRLARLWYEPICVVILGAMLHWFYEQNGMPTRGLPLFLFCGAMCIRVVESIKAKAQERRMMAINDAKIQQEWMVQEHGNRFGN